MSIPVGISACLLGNEVRHNGGHKLSTWCRDVIGPWFDYRPVCPEMEAGLGTPRPAIRLVDIENRSRAIQATLPERDVTDSLSAVARQYSATQDGLCGFIFMEKSPSCGVWRVKRYGEKGNLLPAEGRGIFAQHFIEQHPALPVEEAGRLNDADLRENFVLCVFAWHEWHTALLPALSTHALIRYWSRYKFLVLAHDENMARELGRLLADAGKQPVQLLAGTFFTQLMMALAKPSTRAGNVNALEHLRGFVKRHADRVEKASLTRAIHQYRDGLVPLIVPMALLQHLLDRYPDSYASEQSFLKPYPDELSLRNHK